MKVLFITRGSINDGLGHVTRSRAVAAEFIGKAEISFLVIGDGCGAALLEGYGFDFVADADESHALSVARAFGADIVFLDLLRLNSDFVRELSSRSTTISLSPIFDSIGEVTCVFHRTVYQNPAWPKGPEYRCGLQYAVVSSHCRRVSEEIFEMHSKDTPLSIAVSMGGTDAANKTISVLERLRKYPSPLLIWLLLGEGYVHSYQELVDLMRGSEHEIILAKTNDSMWRVLHLVSLTILAAGTTTYEAAYAGLPSINLMERHENGFLIRELVEKRAALSLGAPVNSGLEQLVPALAGLDQNRDELRGMHQRARSLVDGHGAARIALEAVEFHQERRSKCLAG